MVRRDVRLSPSVGPHGFTLLEVIAVLVILAMIAGGVAWSASGKLGGATLDDAINQLQYRDRLARDHAQIAGEPTLLRFDLSAGLVGRYDSQLHKFVGIPYRLSRSLTIEEIAVAEFDAHNEARSVRSGAVNIPFGAGLSNALGEGSIVGSPTYAVRLRGGDQSRWVLFAGIGGQSVEIANEDEIADIMATLKAQSRDDTD